MQILRLVLHISPEDISIRGSDADTVGVVTSLLVTVGTSLARKTKTAQAEIKSDRDLMGAEMGVVAVLAALEYRDRVGIG